MNQYANGYNPMRHDCAKQGCFNLVRRPKIEQFADCFPGKIAMGDVDGIVEVNGKGLLLEWKSSGVSLPLGQKIMYGRLTKNTMLSVIIVHGDAQTMDIQQHAWFAAGVMHEWVESSLDEVKQAMRDWVEWATHNPSKMQ